MLSLEHTRRNFLKSSIGLTGLTVSSLLSLISKAGTQAPKAKSCIVLYTWGGMSHYESFDPKPDAPSDIRGEFKAIPLPITFGNLISVRPSCVEKTKSIDRRASKGVRFM